MHPVSNSSKSVPFDKPLSLKQLKSLEHPYKELPIERGIAYLKEDPKRIKKVIPLEDSILSTAVVVVPAIALGAYLGGIRNPNIDFMNQIAALNRDELPPPYVDGGPRVDLVKQEVLLMQLLLGRWLRVQLCILISKTFGPLQNI